MHRSYQPITPTNSRILRKKWDTATYSFHRQMVDQAAPMIDNKPPKTYMHLHLKLKNLQVEEQRLAEVERDNRILLEKMSYIMRTKGSVDNMNDYQQKSLNKSKRQRELLRLTHENQAILKRINSKESFYKHTEWEEDHKKQQKYLENVAKYPKNWHKKGGQKLKPVSTGSSINDASQASEEPEKKVDVAESETESEAANEAGKEAANEAGKDATDEAGNETENEAKIEAANENQNQAEDEAEKEAENEVDKDKEDNEGAEMNDERESANENEETEREKIPEAE